MKSNIKEQKRRRRKKSIGKKIRGTSERPRFFLYRSNKYIYAGVSDDEKGEILVSKKGEKNIKSAKALGLDIGKTLKKKKVDALVFDRSGYKYHGRVQALAEGLREAGIEV